MNIHYHHKPLAEMPPHLACFPSQGFSEKILHLSGGMPTTYHIACYGMKDRKAIFQFPFIAESGKKSCTKRKFNLSRMIFQSQPNDFSISGKRFSVLRQTKWSLAEGCLKRPSVCNINIMNGLPCNLKDEGSFFVKSRCKYVHPKGQYPHWLPAVP